MTVKCIGHISEEMIKYSRLPEQSYSDKRLWQFEYNTGTEKGVQTIYSLIHDKLKVPMVLLIGVAGLGKSHLAMGAGWYFMVRGCRCIYYQVEDMMDAIRKGFSLEQKYPQSGGENPNSYSMLMARLERVDLLILDDLGSHNETELACTKLDQIVCYRYDHRLATIITANTITGLSQRILDRCKEGAVVVMTGSSYRGKK